MTDSAKRPEVIMPDLTKPDPLVKFTKSDIAYVYGSKWKQRYFTKVGDDYFPLGAPPETSASTAPCPGSSRPSPISM